MITFDINTDDVVALTRKLEKISDRSIPKAVGSTLNTLAAKTREQIPSTFANKGFVQRNRTFAKRISRYEKVKTFEINRMSSKAGFANVIKSRKSSESMAKHEEGGKFSNKYVTSRFARVSSSKKRNKSVKNRFSNLSKLPLPGTRNHIKKGDKRKFLRVGHRIARTNELASYTTSKGTMIYRVKNKSKDRKRPLKISVLYWERESDTVVKGKHTVRDSALKVNKKVVNYYTKAAQRYIK